MFESSNKNSVRISSATFAGLMAFLAVVLMQPSVIFAQEVDSNSAEQLEEVVVSATRRATDLQATPIAVSALDSGLISSSTAHDLGDLAPYVPNFSAARIAGFNAVSFAMRGTGQNNVIVYFDSPVSVLVDDFVVPSVQTQLLDTFDLEQVEVLRGPQGTLFGKNTTGGVVSVRTKRPEMDAFSANFRAGFGRFGSWHAKGAVNIPLMEDTLALRIVGAYRESDGYMSNGVKYGPITPFVPDSPFAGASGQGDGRDLGGEDAFNGRVKLKWAPSDTVSVLLQYEALRDDSEPPAMVNSTPDPTFVWPLMGFPAPTGDYLNAAGVNTANEIVDMLNARTDVDGYYMNIDWETSYGVVTSITGQRDQETRLPFTASTTPGIVVGDQNLNLFDARRDVDRKTFQQEVRFASEFDGPFNFVAGGFYQHDEIDFCVVTVQAFLDFLGLSTPYGPYNEHPAVTCSTQDAKSYAAFAEGTYDLTERLTLTAGLRVTKDKKNWQGRQEVFIETFPEYTGRVGGTLLYAADFGRYPNGVVTIKHDWSEPSWRVSLGYQWTDDIYLYGSATRGYKSGGFNDQIGLGAPYGDNLDLFAAAADSTDPEFANSYEIGLRTEGMDNRLRFNATGFWVEYSDLQRQINVPVAITDSNGVETTAQVTRYFNAAKARVIGLEAELEAVLTDAFTLNATLGYQDGKYKSYTTLLPAGYDLSSSPLDRTPEWTWSVGGAYTWQLPGLGSLTLSANLNRVDENLYTQSITAESSNTYLDARTLLDASLTYNSADGRYFARIYGRNLTDETHLSADLVVATLFAWSQYAPPRFVGFEAGFNFGN